MTIQEFAAKYRLRTKMDVDGTTIIPGRMGQIYEYSAEEGQLEGGVRFGVMVIPPTLRTSFWKRQSKLLRGVGCRINQNGDHEGAALFDPENVKQVKVAIKAARILRIRQYSEATRQKLRARLHALKG